MKSIPAWFKRELKIIDPEFYVVYDEEGDVFDVHKKCILGTGKNKYVEDCVVAYFTIPNSAALDSMRRRKQLGIELDVERNPERHRKWLFYQQMKTKKAKEEEAIEQITEGLMEIDKYAKRKKVTFS